MSLSPVSFTDGCSEVPVFMAGAKNEERLHLWNSLKELGYRISLFSSGSTLQKAIRQADHNIILLLDWMMPDCDGTSLCKDLSFNPPANMVHTIMVAGQDNKNNIAFALENGADDVILAPFETMEVRVHINVGMRMIFIRQRLIEGYRQLLDHYRYVEKLAKERAEQLVQADRLSTIGVLSAGIAHEVNNPVSFISVNIQTMEENYPVIRAALQPEASEELQVKAREFVGTIPDILAEMRAGVVRVKKIVDGLKTYVHVGQDNQSHFSMITCIDSALELCRSKLKYHVTVVRNYEKTPLVFGDQCQIEQVFVNLFTNAADAIESTGNDGTITVSVRLDGSWVTTTVRDTGPGIPDKELDKVFMPFFTTKSIGKGTGLGLSVSKNIVSDHRGQITVRNHPDGGAVFTILLPPQKGTVA